MSLSDELRDPWGLVVSGVSGGLVWALMGTSAAALPLGVAAAAGVLGAKVLSGVLLNRERPARDVPLVRPPRGSQAAGWLERAERAVRSLDELSASGTGGPLHGQVAGAAQEAGDTLAALARLGAQATAVERALGRVDAAGLEAEAARLADAARRGGPPDVQTEVARSAAAVADRLAVRDRLRAARTTTLARMEAVTLGLEGLVARLAEVLALAETTGGTDDAAGQVAELAAELEGLRAGLAETEEASRGALAAAPPLQDHARRTRLEGPSRGHS